MPWKRHLVSRGVRTVSRLVCAIRPKQGMDVSIQVHHAFPKQVQVRILVGSGECAHTGEAWHGSLDAKGVDTREVVQSWVVEFHGDEIGIHTRSKIAILLVILSWR